jgi:DNA replication protein DnaC
MNPLNHERISERCEQLKLTAINDNYSALAQEHVEAKSPLPDYLLSLLDAEHQARHARSRQMLVRMSGLPAIKTLDDYAFKFAVGAPRKRIELLADVAFIVSAGVKARTYAADCFRAI